MRLLHKPLVLGDITDVENFIHQSITRSRVQLTNSQREELVAEGLAIMLELWRKYDPAKDTGGPARADGSTQGVASFAGYANFLLGRKLGDAYHRMFDHHVKRTVELEDGRKVKRWTYLDPCLSYRPDVDDDQDPRLLGNFVTTTT